jgi:hypothetical protein
MERRRRRKKEYLHVDEENSFENHDTHTHKHTQKIHPMTRKEDPE